MSDQPIPVETSVEPQALVVAPRPPASSMTPEQAKVNAIADLTSSAYARASQLPLNPGESEALQANFPDEAFKPGAAGKENLIYIEHAFLRDRFNQVFGLGGWAIIPRSRWAEDYEFTNSRNQRVQASRVYVEAMLLARGCFVAEAVGEMVYYKNNDSQNFADAVEGAKTAAFRRCAKELGVGLQAWKKDWCEGWWTRKRQPKKAAPPPAPAAAPPADPPKPPTEKTRMHWLNQLKAAPGQENETLYHDFFHAMQWIEQNQKTVDWPLLHVPRNWEEFRELHADAAAWRQSLEQTTGEII